jgi:hypothetical protein
MEDERLGAPLTQAFITLTARSFDFIHDFTCFCVKLSLFDLALAIKG